MEVLKWLLKIATTLLLFFFIFVTYIDPLLHFLFAGRVTYMETTERTIVINSLLTILILIFIPILWLYSFNNFDRRGIFDYLEIKKEGIGKSILFGILSLSTILLLLLVVGIMMKLSGSRVENEVARSIARNLTIPSILFIAIGQATGEEIFFRAFLIKKLSFGNNSHMGVFLSSILFGLAHLSYGNVYQVILPFLIGYILGYTLLRSRNIVSVIIPHAFYDLFALLITRYYFSIIL